MNVKPLLEIALKIVLMLATAYTDYLRTATNAEEVSEA